MRKSRETASFCVQQITNPEIVLVNYVVILDIVLPYIVWMALILKRNIGLPEALKTPIGRIVILYCTGPDPLMISTFAMLSAGIVERSDAAFDTIPVRGTAGIPSI